MKFLGALAVLGAFTLGTAAQATTVLNFDSLGSAGDVVTGDSFGDGTLSATGGPLVLFNANCGPDFPGTSCTGGDPDLATGPSFGTTPQGLVLIIEESSRLDPVPDPDDDARGGSFIFSFDSPVFLGTVTLLDIDTNPRITDVTFDFEYADGAAELGVAAASLFPMLLGTETDDNSLTKFSLSRKSVKELEINFDGSGAVAELTYSVSVVPLPAGAWLLLGGLGALGALRKGQRRKG